MAHAAVAATLAAAIMIWPPVPLGIIFVGRPLITKAIHRLTATQY